MIAQSTGGADPLPLLSYGALGLVVFALLAGLLWAKPAVQRLIEDKDRVTAQRDALLETITRDVLPALVSNTTAATALKPVLEDVVRVLEQVHDDMRPQQPAPRRRTGG